MFIHKYIHTLRYTYAYTRISTYTQKYIHVHRQSILILLLKSITISTLQFRCVYTYIHICIYIYTYIHICLFVSIHVYVCTYTIAHMYLSIHLCLLHICINEQQKAHVHIYIYIYTAISVLLNVCTYTESCSPGNRNGIPDLRPTPPCLCPPPGHHAPLLWPIHSTVM